ncbi:MAG: 6-carboxytetrahydropterin synthase QueD [Candidatus Altiarchaeales archaeon]|nr:6-carboxytetrahydropterin synthase QueD [Candidatus Altiarchaeales archaeon]
MKAGRTFFFDASHHLPAYEGKCEQLHGHTYRLDVVVEGKVGKEGMVLDFNEIKKVVENEVIEKLDHMDLNKVLKNPTAENIAEWIWTQLEGKLSLHSIKLYEGKGKWVEKTK